MGLVVVVVLLAGVVAALALRSHPPAARCNDWQAQIGWEAADRARHGPPPEAALSSSATNDAGGDAWTAWVGVLRNTKTFVGQDGEVTKPSGC